MSKVFWRGSTTGQPRSDWRDLPRAILCRIAQDAPAELGLDVGFTSLVQLTPEAETEIIDAGYLRPPVSSSTYGNYKVHLDIDGNSNAWSGLFVKLLSGGLVLKVESESDSQWYYPRLQPWRHFVPVDTCMEDLDEIIRWVIAHPAAAARIASEGRRLAERLTLAEGVEHGVSVIEAALAKG